MVKKYSREDKMSDAFLVLGSQYYTHARYSAQYQYLPVCVTLFHHSIEMLLKGFLSKHMTSRDLKKIGHNLVGLWEVFKSKNVENDFAQFDITISHLDRFEELRYPDKMVDEGYILNIQLGTPIPIYLPGTEGIPKYSVDVSTLDENVTSIFKACNVSTSPYFKGAPTDLMNALPSSLRPLE